VRVQSIPCTSNESGSWLGVCCGCGRAHKARDVHWCLGPRRESSPSRGRGHTVGARWSRSIDEGTGPLRRVRGSQRETDLLWAHARRSGRGSRAPRCGRGCRADGWLRTLGASAAQPSEHDERGIGHVTTDHLTAVPSSPPAPDKPLSSPGVSWPVMVVIAWTFRLGVRIWGVPDTSLPRLSVR